MTGARILVVDDEIGWIEVCRDSLARIANVVGEGSVGAGRRRLVEESFDVFLADLKLPDGSGLDLVQAAREIDPDLPVIVITAFPTIETAVEAIRRGAYDYLVKPFTPEQLHLVVNRALERRSLRAENRLLARRVQGSASADMVGKSAGLRAVRRLVAQVAPTDSPVMITGESGTGKELVARAIHAGSKRSGRRFVPVDCGALPEPLVESEFFGHERGAFTGADRTQIGLFDYAEGGTLFLDEIGELPILSQAKLLRVLQEKQFRRVGGRSMRQADVRVIAATNRDLEEEVKAHRFREDLFYRLHVFDIPVPPLRERREDIAELAVHFAAVAAGELGREPIELSPDALDVIVRYAWPGNVRELRNTVKRAAIVAGGAAIGAAHLPARLLDELAPVVRSRALSESSFHEARTRAIERFERDFLADLLRGSEGKVSAAAKAAELSRSSLYYLLQRHGLKPATFRASD